MTSRLSILLVVPLVAVGMAGAIVTLVTREPDAAFDYRQRNPVRNDADEVQQVDMNAPEPVAGTQTKARDARCRPGTEGDIRNPWRCTVRYASGARFEFEVRLEADGSFNGVDPTGEHLISGCCVERPRPE